MQEFICQFLSDGTRPCIIRDPVHDYIELTRIEKDLIDTQIFQRLRFISQNSTAFYTYPSNLSSRFEHSLGAAHLAGQFIISALRWSDKNTTEKFLDSFKEFFDSASQKANIDSSAYNRYTYKAILWQITRLIVLMHDIGTLPFSHLAEYAIIPHDSLILTGHDSEKSWQQLQPKLAYHEFVSLMIILKNKEIADVFEDQPDEPRKLLLELVKYAFDPQYLEHPIISAIHSIMSGEIDADRGDYVVRDGRNSGVEFGGYDITRMADFIRLYHKQGAFEILPMELALSSIETFFGERYKLYKWVLFHHHVAQTDTALQHAIEAILRLIKNGNKEITDILDIKRLRYDGLIIDGTYSDDIWMWNCLREVYRYLKKKTPADNEQLFLLRVLECCLHRRKLIPLWKTPIEYQSFSRKSFKGLFERAIFERYESAFKAGIDNTREPSEDQWNYFHSRLSLNLVAQHYLEYDRLKARDLEDSINADAKDFRIILEPKRFVPLKLLKGSKQSVAKILTKDGQVRHLSDFSATVKFLVSSWDQDIHLFAFAVPLNNSKIDVDKARRQFTDGFLRWYKRHDCKFPGY